MATDRQIEANRRNAERSTGPKTDEGKARSRANSTKHGMAGESIDLEIATSPEFADRRAKWAAEYNPVGELAHWAMDRVVAASFQIERCEQALNEVVAVSRERATLSWNQDREVEAATIFGRLAKDPVLASRQLHTSLAGVGLVLEAWIGLLSKLHLGSEGWSEVEESIALDLLGVATELRDGPTMIDAPEGTDNLAFRRELAIEELERLEALRDGAMVRLDAIDRGLAIKGNVAILSKPAKLVQRYERDAWRRYRESMRLIQGQSGPAVIAVPAPTPPVAVAKQPEAVDPSSRTREETRRELRAEVTPLRQASTDQLAQVGIKDEAAWLKLLERTMGPGSATDRTQFVTASVAESPSTIGGR